MNISPQNETVPVIRTKDAYKSMELLYFLLMFVILFHLNRFIMKTWLRITIRTDYVLNALLLVYLSQLEDNLEREKKVRADVEKAKRKIESDLKVTQESVEELERVKRDLEEAVRR